MKGVEEEEEEKKEVQSVAPATDAARKRKRIAS